MSHLLHQCVEGQVDLTSQTPHVRTSAVSRVNASCRIYEWVSNECCLTFECIMSHIYEWVMSHVWMCDVTYMSESCVTFERVVSHISRSHISHILCAEGQVDLTSQLQVYRDSYVKLGTLLYAKWLICACAEGQVDPSWRSWCATWLIHMWERTQSYMW